ncbi:MAG: hypothetical protein D3922_04275 [Candidatus Electrothrix sp. AR1]|nr:hypothetical protein [Candidatus Electrothrix sp. AR1]
MKSVNFGQFTGYIVNGSLVLTGIAATFQAFIDIKPFTEWALSTKVWDLFLAFPMLFLSYLAGITVTKFSGMLFDRFRKRTLEQRVAQIIRVASANNELINTKYEKLSQELGLLQGACLSVSFLGVAVLLNVLTTAPSMIDTLLSHKSLFFAMLGVLLVISAYAFLVLASKTHDELTELSTQVDKLKQAAATF